MNYIEFISRLYNAQIRDGLTDKIQTLYNCTLGTQAKKIISLASEDLFIEIEEIFRILTVDEIINMSRDFGSKLIPQKLVPLIDNGDNIFICYDANVHKFCKYNLADDKKIKEFEDITKYRP